MYYAQFNQTKATDMCTPITQSYRIKKVDHVIILPMNREIIALIVKMIITVITDSSTGALVARSVKRSIFIFGT